MNARKEKKNIMIVGIPEPSENNSNPDNKSDSEVVLDMLKSLKPDFNGNEMKVIRLGRRPPADHQRSRPIKVILNDESEAVSLLRSARKLKSVERFKTCHMFSDKTPRQQEFYRGLKQQLDGRTQNGETNLKIVYKNDIPRIVSLN